MMMILIQSIYFLQLLLFLVLLLSKITIMFNIDTVNYNLFIKTFIKMYSCLFINNNNNNKIIICYKLFIKMCYNFQFNQ